MTKPSKKNSKKVQPTKAVKDLDVKPTQGSKVKGGPTAVEIKYNLKL